MFKTMQRKFEEKLLRKKSQMAITKPKSPDFYKTKSRPLKRDYVNETAPKIDGNKKINRCSSANGFATSEPVKQPSSTRAMELS